MDDQVVERRTITMYPRQWETAEAHAKREGFSLSLAMRRIVDEWQQLQTHKTVEQPAPSLQQE